MDKKKKRWVIGAVILLCIVFAVFLQPSRPAKKAVSTGDAYVAVIRVEGPIVGAADIPSNLFSGGTTASSGRLMKEIRQAAADPAAKAVLLRINSPGGSATASQAVNRWSFRWATCARRAGTGSPRKAIGCLPTRPR